jgi:hypothetical protein
LRYGIDPTADKQRRKADMAADGLGTFEKVARAWYETKSTTLTPRYPGQVLSRLE